MYGRFVSLAMAVAVGVTAVLLQGCVGEVMRPSRQQVFKIKDLQISPAMENVERVRKKLVRRIYIPAERETEQLRDPFVISKLPGGISIEQVRRVQEEVTADEGEEITKRRSGGKAVKTKEVAAIGRVATEIEESPKLFEFVGTLYDGKQYYAIMRNVRTNKSYVVMRGTNMGGYKVVSVSQREVVLVRGAEQLIIPKRKRKIQRQSQ